MFEEPKIDTWLKGLAAASVPLPQAVREVLAEMEEVARERRFPIVGPQVGRLLFQLATLRGAQRIFELGSGFGYSTTWFAAATPAAEREIHHTDGSADNSAAARDHLHRAGLDDGVTFHVGDAVEAMRGVSGDFDIVFMDIDKHGYAAAYEHFADRVRPGGVVIVDNLIWGGKIARGEQDADCEGIRRYLELMWHDPRYLSSLMPVRDGVGVSVRVG